MKNRKSGVASILPHDKGKDLSHISEKAINFVDSKAFGIYII
jgi:hypothetical protein